MDGLHDLGGKQGFGRVKYPSAPHNENWRPLVRALHAFGIESHIYNMDEFRHAIERMTPRHHRAHDAATLHQRTLFRAPPDRDSHIAYREGNRNAGGLSGPLGPGRLPFAPQSFAIGETVRVKNEFVSGHVRVPAYIRGKTGTIVRVSTPTPFPDAAGHNMQAEMEPTYDVRFRARDLWPDTSDEALNHVAVFQSYLEKVESA